MRLFVGIEIEAALARTIADLVGELRRRLGRLAPRAKVTWTGPERLHLTVRFIGETDEQTCRLLVEALRPEIPLHPFPVTLAGAGAFPDRGAPRVLWAGVTGGADGLRQLEREVSARLAAAGIPPEQRPYSPHLTLARVRDPAGVRPPALFHGLGASVLGAMQVGAITLFESRTSPKGSTYVPLQRTRLQ